MKNVLIGALVILALIVAPIVAVALHIVADILKFIVWEVGIAVVLGIFAYFGWRSATRE